MNHVLCLLAVLLVASTSNPIVIRHDVADAEYRVNVAEFPTLALLPGEGHGVLISKQWLVTAAHAAVWRPVHEVTLNGVSRWVAKVIVHPGYKAAPKELQSGGAAPLMKFMSASDDIALIKLEQPANDVRPATLYRGADEVGKIAEIVGGGATGNGLAGEYADSPHRSELCRAYGRIITADERWLAIRFDAPPQAVALEGMPADGDSGAPIFIEVNRRWQLAGVVSHKLATGKLSDFRCCRYGQVTYQVRISRYADWIDSTVTKY